jgi:hypothetical protein
MQRTMLDEYFFSLLPLLQASERTNEQEEEKKNAALSLADSLRL